MSPRDKQAEARRELVRERDLGDARWRAQLADLAFERAAAVIAEHHHGHAVDAARAQRSQLERAAARDRGARAARPRASQRASTSRTSSYSTLGF